MGANLIKAIQPFFYVNMLIIIKSSKPFECIRKTLSFAIVKIKSIGLNPKRYFF